MEEDQFETPDSMVLIESYQTLKAKLDNKDKHIQ